MSLCFYDWRMQYPGLRLAFSNGHNAPDVMDKQKVTLNNLVNDSFKAFSQ